MPSKFDLLVLPMQRVQYTSVVGTECLLTSYHLSVKWFSSITQMTDILCEVDLVNELKF